MNITDMATGTKGTKSKEGLESLRESELIKRFYHQIQVRVKGAR